MDFEWDPAKDLHNREKHGITFADASTVFDDPLARTVADPRHSVGEFRFVTIGYASSGTLITVAHTDRDERIRIITARAATSKERRSYESER